MFGALSIVGLAVFWWFHRKRKQQHRENGGLSTPLAITRGKDRQKGYNGLGRGRAYPIYPDGNDGRGLLGYKYNDKGYDDDTIWGTSMGSINSQRVDVWAQGDSEATPTKRGGTDSSLLRRMRSHKKAVVGRMVSNSAQGTHHEASGDIAEYHQLSDHPSFSASSNPYASSQSPPLLAGLVGKLRSTSGAASPPRPSPNDGPHQRFDILADEDRSEFNEKHGTVRSGTSGQRSTSGTSATGDSEGRVEAAIIGVGVRATPSNRLSARRRVSGKVVSQPERPTKKDSSGSGTALRDPFEDGPLETFYDEGIINYVEGNTNPAKHDFLPPTSAGGDSLNSEAAKRNSVAMANIETATKINLSTSAPSMLSPLKRNDSILSRWGGALFGLGGGGGKTRRMSRGSMHGAEMEGFLDPTPPPVLDPISEGQNNQNTSKALPSTPRGGLMTESPVDLDDTPVAAPPLRPPLLPHHHDRYHQSLTSVHTSVTADSEALARYSDMHIVQREFSASSATERGTLSTPTRGSSGTSDADQVVSPENRQPPEPPLKTDSPSLSVPPPLPEKTIVRADSAEPRLEQTSTTTNVETSLPATPRGPRPAPSRHPTHIDMSPRRNVRDMVASINKRDPTGESVVPSPAKTRPLVVPISPPPMHSPHRGWGGPKGGRERTSAKQPVTMYETRERGRLEIANPE